ncbi:aminotransferase class V-fold PLP-dependent enzyme [Castellaniella sp.]|uniref:aminotransferase class V-fold PLP-dependent enzyme n=1 Tax=Castellaniella sp. TaxID=1955812 RepID=UPI0035677137
MIRDRQDGPAKDAPTDFKHLWPLDPQVKHLNHGAYGATPCSVIAEQDRLRRLVDRNPHKWFSQMLESRVVEARTRLAGFLHARPERVALVDNVSAGVSAVLASLPLTAADQILVTDHLYGAVRFAVERLSARTGAQVCEIHIPPGAAADDVVERLISRVGSRTRLAVVDHVSANTCMLFPVRQLQEQFRARGVRVLWDGAHVPGMLPVDLDGLAPDFWVGNFHKWAFAPRGTALLYVRDPAETPIRSNVVSWNETEPYPRNFDRVGTSDLTAWVAAPSALDFIHELGEDRLHAHNNALARHAQQVIAEAIGVDTARLWGDDALSIRAVPLPEGPVTSRQSAMALQSLISDQYRIETAIRPLGGSGILRVSAQRYNTIEEFEELAGCLRALF